MDNDSGVQLRRRNPCKIAAHVVGTCPVPLAMCGTLSLAADNRQSGCLRLAYMRALLSFADVRVVTHYFFTF